MDHPEDFDRYSPMVSRLLHLIAVDILTTGVALKLGQQLRPMLQEIKKNLRAKRYAVRTKPADQMAAGCWPKERVHTVDAGQFAKLVGAHRRA